MFTIEGIRIKTEEASFESVQMIRGFVLNDSFTMSVYCFYVDGILIDTGSQTVLELFKRWFSKQPFSKVFITHRHEDHTGGAAWIQKTLKKPIYIHHLSVEASHEEEHLLPYREMTWGARQPFSPLPIPLQFQSDHYNWEAIYTPGHATDHYAFYCIEKKLMFTGDLFVIAHTKLILDVENMYDMIESLKRLLTYDFTSIFCCHAGYIENGRACIIEKIRYLEQLKIASKQLYNKGLTIEQIREKLLPKRYPIIEISNNEWDSLHIIRSFLNDYPSITHES